MMIQIYMNSFPKKNKMTKAQKASLNEYNEWRSKKQYVKSKFFESQDL